MTGSQSVLLLEHPWQLKRDEHSLSVWAVQPLPRCAFRFQLKPTPYRHDIIAQGPKTNQRRMAQSQRFVDNSEDASRYRWAWKLRRRHSSTQVCLTSFLSPYSERITSPAPHLHTHARTQESHTTPSKPRSSGTSLALRRAVKQRSTSSA